MFLDPEPLSKRQKHGMSGFFSSQRPIESPKDHRTSVRRKSQPLGERTASENNQQNPGLSSPEKLTVRLIKPSPTPSAEKLESDDDDLLSDKKENRQEDRVHSSTIVKEARASKQGSGASSQGLCVSDIPQPANETEDWNDQTNDSLLSTNTTHAIPRTETVRRTGSSGNYSTTSTLRDRLSGRESVFWQSVLREDDTEDTFSLSQGTTLRGTPTPYEQDHGARVLAEQAPTPESDQTLQTLSESSSEERSTSTVRIVPPATLSSSPTAEHQLRSEPSLSSSSPASDSDAPPPVPLKSPRRSSSVSSIPAPLVIRKSIDTPTSRHQASPESFVQSEATYPESSSPNFIAYYSDSSPLRPRSRSQPSHPNPLRSNPIHHTTSIESIQSRLQYPALVQPETGRSLFRSNSSASILPSSSSTDTLPPLVVPKKRLRHKPAALSLKKAAATASATRGSMADEDIDTLPYPREPFSSHLSTIASESDHQSRVSSQQFSHFSLGSGVLTGDDSSSIPLSGTWPRRRRESAPISSMLSESSPAAAGSSEEEAGDMTMGLYREESAKPQPLFQPTSPGASPGAAAPGGKDRKYDGPLPPLPPVPKSRESEENFDKVSELHTPRLREKRSGYSLRRRSNSTPSRSLSRPMSQASYAESQRYSNASSIFPTWAKNFYGHGAALMSASKISLGTGSTPQRNGQHARNDSQWTGRSVTSRLGTGYSEHEMPSPVSSHFLPSIFRPKTRKDSEKRKSRAQRSERRPNVDSMAIFSDPLAQGEVLPSGQPKFGQLKDGSEGPPRPLPRKYSKQRRWDEMEFPRPMTKDRLSDFGMHASDPHLGPSKRSTNRTSMWRAPSFVESLDTLVRGRGNRQILLFALGFVCPLLWMVAAVLPIPNKPVPASALEQSLGGSEDDIQAAMMKHEAGDAEKRWSEEKQYLKARWWRYLNRIMSVIGLLVIGAVVALAVVATTT